MSKDRYFWAYVGPLGAFMLMLALAQMLGDGAKYWVYPLQVVVCGGLLIYYWGEYEWGKTSLGGLGLAVVAGLAIFLAWVAPQVLMGAAPRTEGFNPDLFADDARWWWATVLGRCVRLMLIVPLVEEFFWRGFLQRYLINDKNFRSVAFGTFSWFSLVGVTVVFMLIHEESDWPAAIFAGLLWGWLAVKTRSLLALVVSHAVANIALGAYILSTRQWGFW